MLSGRLLVGLKLFLLFFNFVFVLFFLFLQSVVCSFRVLWFLSRLCALTHAFVCSSAVYMSSAIQASARLVVWSSGRTAVYSGHCVRRSRVLLLLDAFLFSPDGGRAVGPDVQRRRRYAHVCADLPLEHSRW